MLSNKTLFVSTALLPAVLIACIPAAHAQTAATLVVPGHSLGRLSLGMTRNQVHTLLGKASGKERLSSTLSSELFGLTEVTYRGGRVVQLEKGQARFWTRTGLFAQSRMDAIAARLGPQIHSVRTDPENYILHYFDNVGAGLAFEWSGPKSGEVGRDDVPDTLIVHKKDVPVIVNKGSQWISSSSILQLSEGDGQ